jgi:hypothetical protein
MDHDRLDDVWRLASPLSHGDGPAPERVEINERKMLPFAPLGSTPRARRYRVNCFDSGIDRSPVVPFLSMSSNRKASGSFPRDRFPTMSLRAKWIGTCLMPLSVFASRILNSPPSQSATVSRQISSIRITGRASMGCSWAILPCRVGARHRDGFRQL